LVIILKYRGGSLAHGRHGGDEWEAHGKLMGGTWEAQHMGGVSLGYGRGARVLL